jgi:hypothetical protein
MNTLTDPDCPRVRDQINGGVTQEARADLPTILLRIVDAYDDVIAPLAKQSIRDAARALTTAQAEREQLEARVKEAERFAQYLAERIDGAYAKSARLAERAGSEEIAKAIRNEAEWEGLSCCCGGGWKVGHAAGCPEDAEAIRAALNPGASKP